MDRVERTDAQIADSKAKIADIDAKKADIVAVLQAEKAGIDAQIVDSNAKIADIEAKKANIEARLVVCKALYAELAREGFAPLTAHEKTEALSIGQWGDKTSPQRWCEFVTKVKEMRGGVYPSDWHPMIIMGRLFSDQGQPMHSGLSFNDPALHFDTEETEEM
jgi:hypothetical protein